MSANAHMVPHAFLIESLGYLLLEGNPMKAALVSLSLSLGMAAVAVAQSSSSASSPEPLHYTHSELRELTRNPNSTQQYHVLATYYSQQQTAYLEKASSERAEWERRSSGATGAAAKGFTPANASRNRYEYFICEASHAGEVASHYRDLEQPSQLSTNR